MNNENYRINLIQLQLIFTSKIIHSKYECYNLRKEITLIKVRIPSKTMQIVNVL